MARKKKDHDATQKRYRKDKHTTMNANVGKPTGNATNEMCAAGCKGITIGARRTLSSVTSVALLSHWAQALTLPPTCVKQTITHMSRAVWTAIKQATK